MGGKIVDHICNACPIANNIMPLVIYLLNCLFRPVKAPVQRVVFVASVPTGFGEYRTVFGTILGVGVPYTWYMWPIFDHRWSHGQIFW